MAAPPSPAPIPSDLDILRSIAKYFLRNRSFPYDVGEHGMIDYVRNYLRSDDADPQQVRQRVNNLQEQYLATRHTMYLGQAGLESLPLEDLQKYATAHFLWDGGDHHSDSVHGRQDVDQTNQASSSRAAGIHHSDSDTAMATAENTPEKSSSADRSSNTYFSSDENTPQKASSAAHQSNTNVNIVDISSDSPNQSSLRISKDCASSSTTKRRPLLVDLNQQGGDIDTTATAAQDINILTKIIEYSEVYPYVSAETWSEIFKNWLRSNADPGEVGKRIQELREMYGKYLILNNNNDEGGKPVYSDSPDGRLLLDLSKKLWQHEFGNPNDDSAGGKSRDDKS